MRMARPASFYTSARPGEPDAIIGARKHDEDARMGDLAGTNLSYAQTAERPTQIVLWREELPLPPDYGTIIIFSDGLGFHVDNVKPPDGDTITVEVSPVTENLLIGMQTPEGVVLGV